MDLSREKGSVDPQGHALFTERVQLGLAYLGEALEAPQNLPRLKTTSTHWVITGIGSSEAHGRFLAHLIHTYTPYTAEFWDLSRFISRPNNPLDAGLIILTQGLSSNAQLALKKRHLFKQCVLFSSVTEETGAHEKKTLLEELKEHGVQHIPYRPDNEYTLLIRVAGPITGYLACLQWVKQALNSDIPSPPHASFLKTLESARKEGKASANKDLVKHIAQGCLILTQAPLSEFAHNLAYKLTEGLFAPNTHICDILSFSHGPFQARCRKPSHVMLLLDKNAQGKYLGKKAESLLQYCTTSHSTYEAKLSTPWNIFEYEMFLNGLLEASLPIAQVDQINWPGKGKDLALYNISDIK